MTIPDMKSYALRAQCQVNIATLLTTLGAPPVAVVRVEEDRIFCAPNFAFIQWVGEAKDENGGPRFNKDTPNIKLHPGATSGWREDVTFCALQVCVMENGVLEIDIDLGGARTDLVGALTHVGEVLHNKVSKGKTDHLKIRKSLLSKRGLVVNEVTNVEIAALVQADKSNKELEEA